MIFDSDNTTLKDQCIYRFVENILSPTYDFSCPIVDSIEELLMYFEVLNTLIEMINIKIEMININ